MDNKLTLINDSWKETYFEVTRNLLYDSSLEDLSTGKMWELADEITDKFESEYKDYEWQGDYFDKIDNFVEKYLKKLNL